HVARSPRANDSLSSRRRLAVSVAAATRTSLAPSCIAFARASALIAAPSEACKRPLNDRKCRLDCSQIFFVQTPAGGSRVFLDVCRVRSLRYREQLRIAREKIEHGLARSLPVFFGNA